MGGVIVAATLLAALAGAAALMPRPGVARLWAVKRRRGAPRQASRNNSASGTAVSPRRRAVAAGLAAVAGAAVVGGPGGWFAGSVIGVTAWVGFGRLEPAAVIRRRQQVAAAVPLAAELLAVAVAAGAPPDGAAEAVGRAIGGPLGEALSAAAAATRMGADPPSVWAGLMDDPVTRPLGRAMLRSATRGVSPVGALKRAARDARDAARWSAEARARSLGAKAAAPLGLCFLPAFVLVGIVPLVATLAMPLLP